MEQPQHHLFHRARVETEYARLCEDTGLGLTTWSPIAAGLLDPAKNAAVARRAPIASELGGRPSQLHANLGALALLDKLTPEVVARIDAITAPLAD